MGLLSVLPVEVLFQIFRGLDNIDDALHLGRSCRAISRLLDNEVMWLDIMRAIITISKVHELDLRICRLLDLRQTILAFYRTAGKAVNLQSRDVRQCFRTGFNDVTNEEIVDIVVRWHGLRVLRDLYTELQPTEDNYVRATAIQDDQELNNLLFQLSRNGRQFYTPSTASRDRNASRRALSCDQTARFYKALSRHWLRIETRWCFRHLLLQGVTVVPEVQKELSDLWYNDDGDMLDYLDLLEVMQFQTEHLFPRYLYCLEVPCQEYAMLIATNQRKQMMQYCDDRLSPQALGLGGSQERRNCLRRSQDMFTPADYIALAAQTARCSEQPDVSVAPSCINSILPYPTVSPYNRTPNGVRQLEQRVQSNPGIFGYDLPNPADLRYIRNSTKRAVLVECHPRTRMEFVSGSVDFMAKWDKEVRGSIFWWAQSSIKAASNIDRWMDF